MCGAEGSTELDLIEENGARFVEGQPGRTLMCTAEDVGLVIEACFSNGVRCALLDAKNLTERFFDLSSGEAGTILQKLRSYHIQIAVVCAPDSVRFSSRFAEMAEEESRKGYFRVFETREAARGWLTEADGPF